MEWPVVDSNMDEEPAAVAADPPPVKSEEEPEAMDTSAPAEDGAEGMACPPGPEPRGYQRATV